MAIFEDNNTQNRIELKKAIPLELPLCISIEPAEACNFKCTMCYHSLPEWNMYNRCDSLMSMEMFIKCIDDIEGWVHENGSRIKLMKLYSMGEPLINPNIGKMVYEIKKRDLCDTLEITSNASLLTAKVSEELVESGLDVFRASIYSVKNDRNTQITQNPAFTVEGIADNIRYMKEYRDKSNKKIPFISAKMIDSYSDENELFLKTYSAIADEAYIDKFTESMPDNRLMKNYYLDRYMEAYEDDKRKKLSNRKCCRYPFTHMTVKSNGQVVICCNDWMSKTLIGDIGNSSLKDIWRSKELYNFRKMMLLTKGEEHVLCRDCEIPQISVCPEDDIDDFPVDRLL